MARPDATVASLAMYPFPSLRAATDTLWSCARRHLGWGPVGLEWSVLPPEVWQRDDVLVAQACGWPLVTRLFDEVAVVGAFDYDVPGARSATYRSVIIGRDPRPLHELAETAGVVAAVNDTDSLSGWVSLQHAWGGTPPSVVTTGSHVDSVRAVVAGRADVASIDAVTWFHLGLQEPAAVRPLHVIGRGPRVPCLPLVTASRFADELPALRAALSAAVADPDIEEAVAALRIREFVPFDLADYLPVRSLLP